MVDRITIGKQLRGFAAGTEIEFRSGVNLLVGDLQTRCGARYDVSVRRAGYRTVGALLQCGCQILQDAGAPGTSSHRCRTRDIKSSLPCTIRCCFSLLSGSTASSTKPG